MARTIRKVPKRGKHIKWLRTPRHRHKLLAGEPLKQIVDDWSDKPVAANKEMRNR